MCLLTFFSNEMQTEFSSDVCCDFPTVLPSVLSPAEVGYWDVILNLLSQNVLELVLIGLIGYLIHSVVFEKWFVEMNSVQSLVLGLVSSDPGLFDS